MTRVLVTGGTGVLGRQVVARLKDSGYLVRVMSRNTAPNQWVRRKYILNQLPLRAVR